MYNNKINKSYCNIDKWEKSPWIIYLWFGCISQTVQNSCINKSA